RGGVQDPLLRRPVGRGLHRRATPHGGPMKRALCSLALLGLAAAVAPACNNGFPQIGQGKKLVVTLAPTDNIGSLDSPLGVRVVAPGNTFHVHVEAQLPDGTLDTSFNGYINLSVQPG